MFNIEFIKKRTQDSNFITGQITIGNFSETFTSSLSYWNKNDYLNQWLNTIKGAIEKNVFTGCLITSMVKPIKKNHIFCWPVYREKNKVYIQNRILFIKDIKGRFDINKISKYVSPHTKVNEDGDKISEWKVSVDDLKIFLKQLEDRIL